MALLSRRTFACHATALSLAACTTAGGGVLPPLRAARFVLLGELHDNAEHHRARAAVLRELLADGRPTRVLFEQLPLGHDTAIAAAPRDAEAVASAGQLDRRAWAWPLHKPLFDAALEGGAVIGGANLDREALRAVMGSGASAAPAALQTWLADARWTSARQATQEASIDAGHCGLLPRSQWPAMVLAQRTRDAAMARALLDTAPGHRAVLIAGNGHVRRDVGVPFYLGLAGVAAADIVSIAYLEPGNDAASFDSVQRLPAPERSDPCAALRERAR